MTTDRKDKAAAAVLALFALPFVAGGVFAAYLAASTLIAWQRMSHWVEVPARLESLDLREHRAHNGGSTYDLAAQYTYEYAGRDYRSGRVAVTAMADNFGDFHQRLYAQLRRAQRTRESHVVAYVDAENPADAALNRDLRWGVLVFEAVFALVFGAVGFGLLYGATYGFKAVAAERVLQARYPREPWRWRRDWADGRILASTRAHLHGAVGLALLCNVIAWPATLVLPSELGKGHLAALAILLLLAVGIGLAAYAARAWLQLRRFRVATLVLRSTPVPRGGRLQASVHVDAVVPTSADFRVDLSCVQTQRTRRRNGDTTDRVLWQNQWTIAKERCQLASTFTEIPLDLPVPDDVQCTTSIDGLDHVTWRLEVAATCPGPDFWCRFEVPVFDIGQRGARTSSPGAGADAAPPPRPDARRLAALGIELSPAAHGGETWTFRRGAHKNVALGLTAMTALWSAIAAGLWCSDAPRLFPLAFSAFDLLLFWWTLDLWLGEYRVTLDDGLLTSARRGPFAGRPVQLPLSLVQAVRTRRGMQAGNKLYYDLQAETADGRRTLARSIGDYDVATWLAARFMTVGRRRHELPSADEAASLSGAAR